MLKTVLAALLILSRAEAGPSNNTQLEIALVIPTDQKERYQTVFEEVYELNTTLCSHEITQRDTDILALQTALSYGKTAPEISHNLRQSAIKQWNKQNASSIVKQAVSKVLTFGTPPDGYAAYDFEGHYLNRLPLEERTRLKKEFEQALAGFYPRVKKQLRQEWLKKIPSFEAVDAAVFAAGLDHDAAVEIFSALISHQVYGWAISGFASEDDLNNLIWSEELGSRREWLQRFYREAIRIQNQWNVHELKVTEINQYQLYASKLNEMFRQMPRDIRPEVVVLTARNYTEKLPATLNQLALIGPAVDQSILGLTDRLFNQNLLFDYWRFAGLGLEQHFYQQIKPLADSLGMVPVFDSLQLIAFRKAQIPERTALLHVDAIRQDQHLAHLISQLEARPISMISAEKIMAWSNYRECRQDPAAYLLSLSSSHSKEAVTHEKAVIKTVADLANYAPVIDHTILASQYPRKKLEDLRHQFLMITFHPKAESVNFDINPEFRRSLEKMFSNSTLNEFQTVLLEDHLMRLEQMLDRQIGYDMSILAHSSFYREKFIREMYPQVAYLNIPEQSETSLRHFLTDGQRVFRRLQQLEIDVMTRVKESDKATEWVLQDVLSEWERENGWDGKKKTLSDRLQWNLVMREMKDHPEMYASISSSEMKDMEMIKNSVFSRIVRDYVPGLGNPKM